MQITRLHRQHTSVVTTVPKEFCKIFKLCAGDYLQWNEWKDGETIMIKKLDLEAIKNAANKRNLARKDKSRRT